LRGRANEPLAAWRCADGLATVRTMNEWRFPAWDPVIIQLYDPIHLRWYGFMFLLAFVVGQWILKRLARARFLPIDEEKVYDLIVWLVFGVLIGGRVGYALFYSEWGWRDPLEIFKLWRGGLAFHGGILGVCIALAWFAVRHRVSGLRLADGCAMGGLPGIAFVRLANFINGELYGRVCNDGGPAWAMRFPTEDRALELLKVAGWPSTRMKELAVQKAVHGPWPGMPKELEAVPAWDSIKAQIPLRHPSQLYEMFGEGVLLGIVMFLLWRATRARPLGAGVYGGVFLAGYGCVRFVIEFYRQPDKQFETRPGEIGTVLMGLSMGQVLCSLMILAGLVLIVTRRGKGGR
jgi:phosphatidylglycerol:prolipoprotein diacylglycerol transferase